MLNAVLCGLLGAAASVLGKLALSESAYLNTLRDLCRNVEVDNWSCDYVILGARCLLFLSMVFTNAAMIARFLKSMEKNASVTVTVVSSATNYLASGAVGLTVFGEPVGPNWCLGSLCICLGLCLVGISQEGFPKLRGANRGT